MIFSLQLTQKIPHIILSSEEIFHSEKTDKDSFMPVVYFLNRNKLHLQYLGYMDFYTPKRRLKGMSFIIGNTRKLIYYFLLYYRVLFKSKKYLKMDSYYSSFEFWRKVLDISEKKDSL